MMNYRYWKYDLMMYWDSGDRWGSAMSLFFDVCSEMFNRNGHHNSLLPEQWRYHAGIDTRDQEVSCDIVLELDDDALLHLGNILHRLTGIYEQMEIDY